MAYTKTGYNADNVILGNALQENSNRLDVLESGLVHPDHSGETPAVAFSLVGDPVSFGDTGIGVVVGNNAAAETDIQIIQTEGVFALTVEGHDGTSTHALVAGDQIFLQTDGTLDADVTGGKPFGIVLEAVAGSATGVTAAVAIGNSVMNTIV